MSKELRLQVILTALDKASAPFKAMLGSSNQLARGVKAARDNLKSLEQANARMEAFRQTSKDVAITGNAMQAATAKVAALKREIAATGTPTNAQAAALKKATQAAGELKEKNQALLQKQQQLRSELEQAGTPTRELAKHQLELKGKISAATTALAEQEQALKKHGETMKKMAAARAQYDKAMDARNKLAGAGVSMIATGAAMGAPVVKAVQDYSAFEDAMLGVARQVEGARNAAGQLTPVYYEMGEAIKSMSERIPMATTEIAALIEAGARMGIQGKENLLAFAETTATTATAFDLPVEEVGDSMAKLAQLYGVPIAKISELGDAINWLDDNALSKGGDIIDVMQRIAGTATGLGVAYQEAAALGSTFLSLGAGAEVAASASNAMMRELSVANMQSKRFQAGLEMLKLDGAEIQLSMSTDATGTIIRVMEAIKALPKEQQIEAATRLFGKEYGDDAAKLANNIEEYRRQLEMVRSEEQKGSMQREAAARMQNMSAQYELAKNSVFNLSSQIGESLKPALLSLMQVAASVLNGIRAWVKDHPVLTGVLVKGLAVTAAIVTVLGALALAVAAVIGPLAILRYGFAMLSIMGGGPLPMLMTLGKTILPMVGNAILFIGRALMMNPIGLLITAIAGAAFLIYRYWGPISTFFSGLWTNITTFARTAWGSLTTWFATLPAQMLTIGGQIIDGLWQGLSSKWEGLKAKVSEIANSISGAVKGALGIHSPSRVFAELGGYTMQGLQMGLQAASQGPLASVKKIAGQIATAGAVTLGATGQVMAMPLDMAAQAVQPATQAIRPALEILQPAAQAVQPVIEALQPTTQAIRPVLEILQPAAQAVQPVIQALQPTTQAIRPALEILQPAAQAVQPVIQALQPTTQAIRPALEILQPAAQVVQPAIQALQPATQAIRPALEILQPAAQAVQPVIQALQPTTQAIRPMLDGLPQEAPALAVDNRPPITAAQAAGGGGMAAGPIQITIHAAPGMDEARLADLVAQKVAELQRNQAAAGRSRLTDSD